MDELTWPQKLALSIRKTAGEEIEREVMAGEKATDDPVAKAAWTAGAMDRLDCLVPDVSDRKEIMARCSCACAVDVTRTLRAEYERTGDLDQVLEFSYCNPFFIRPRREGNTIYFTKAPRDPEAFEKANTPHERQMAYCHCEQVRARKGEISLTHCYCGAGWYQGIMEGILGRPVEIELVKSVLQGDDACVIAVHI
ncbi:MAG: hypothetical protein KKA42_04455 [candidate division Zixibacteria bacterium]|nr:hypothetical protein [candidate division Zixibacteria bacterium]